MAVKEIPITEFETADGQRFRDKTDAQRHDIELSVKARWDEFKHVAGYADKGFTCVYKWELLKAGLLGQADLLAPPEPPQ